jgi:adenosylmethionine-8-amino-7-oxononanoate aminotransferase
MPAMWRTCFIPTLTRKSIARSGRSSSNAIRVFDTDGKAYIEGLAGLWSVAVGFGEKRLVDAATEHLKKLPYYHSFAHKSHRPAIELAERLVSMTPQRANKVLAHRTAPTSRCLSR